MAKRIYAVLIEITAGESERQVCGAGLDAGEWRESAFASLDPQLALPVELDRSVFESDLVGVLKRAGAGAKCWMQRRAENIDTYFSAGYAESKGGFFSDRKIRVDFAEGLVYIGSRSRTVEYDSAGWALKRVGPRDGGNWFRLVAEDFDALVMRVVEAELHARLSAVDSGDDEVALDGVTWKARRHDIHGVDFCHPDGWWLDATGDLYDLDERIERARAMRPDLFDR